MTADRQRGKFIGGHRYFAGMISPPSLSTTPQAGALTSVELHGAWDIRFIRGNAQPLMEQLRLYADKPVSWDVSAVENLDTTGAALLWQAWDRKRPAMLLTKPEDAWMFDSLTTLAAAPQPPAARDPAWPLLKLGKASLSLIDHGAGMLGLLGSALLDAMGFLRTPAALPWREISANIYRAGAQALPITALVALLVGIVLSYLSGGQLRALGAEGYIVNIIGIGMVRELGPLLAAILNAGRSGSSITAQIGVMRVTEELDAMSVIGLPHTVWLVLPKMIGQLVALPLIVVCTDVVGLFGGMLGAHWQLGMSYSQFLFSVSQVIPLASFWFGVGKGALFGLLIALVACHFGLRIRPDTESLRHGTTQAVVVAITVVLIADAALAMLFSSVGTQAR